MCDRVHQSVVLNNTSLVLSAMGDLLQGKCVRIPGFHGSPYAKELRIPWLSLC